jgi:hypothetical protein
MTVDIARLDHNAVVAFNGANDALARLGQWVEAASQAHRLVAGLVDTAFIPDSYRVKVDPRATPEQKAAARDVAIGNATAAVLQGVTLGIDPLMALQQIYLIHGRPGMYAKMMVALVQSRGHEVWTVEGECTDTRAVVYGRRKGSENVERITITMDQARRAKWTTNQAYSTTPQDMLWARAASRVCDRIASDVLKGIASVEEIQDTIHTTAEVGNGTRTVTPRRRAAPPVVDATEDPPLDETPEGVETPSEPQEPVQTVGGITPKQQKMMHALLNKRGRGDREVGLVFIAGVIGREIESTKELTVAEAAGVIDVLDTEGDEEPTLDVDGEAG